MQKDFCASLLDPNIAPPKGVIGPHGRPAGKRFDVYRNNVVTSLTEALAAGFPVVHTLVGVEFFTAMAGAYVRQFPPKTPMMIFYGVDFAQFLETFPPVAHLAYLPDVARLEYARRLAYHAADATACNPDTLGQTAEGDLPNLRMILHPALQIVPSSHPVFSIWRFNSTDDKSPLPQAGETVLITRPALELQMRVIPQSTAVFLEALQNTLLGTAVETAMASDPNFDLTSNLSELLSAGLVIDIK
ncbi:MAG: DNA-binding domain-containing protein [Paracoccaceae bacterium]